MKLPHLSPTLTTNIPVAAAFTLAAVLIWSCHIARFSVAFFLGVIAGGLVDIDHHTSGRVRNMMVMLISFSLSAVAVELSRHQILWRPIVMTVIVFISILPGAVDNRYRTLAFGTLTVALYTTLTEQPGQNWYTAPIFILAGATLYQIITLIYHLIFPNRPVEDALIAAYRGLAEVIAVKAMYFDPDETPVLAQWQHKLNQGNRALNELFNRCRDGLFIRLGRQQKHSRSNTRRQLRDYLLAQDIHERINSSHFNYDQLSRQLQYTDILYRIKDLVLLQAQACTQIADHLQYKHPYTLPEQLKRKTVGLLNSAQQQAWPEIERLIKNLKAINHQLAIPENNCLTGGFDDPRIAAPAYRAPAQALKALRDNLNFHSLYFRHALRMAIITFPVAFIVEYFKLPLGYWILLTVIFVCQPNYAATQQKIRQRIAGTLIGVIIGSFLPLLIPSLITKLVLIVITCILFFYYRTLNYGYSTFFITVQVFIGLSIIGIKTVEAAPARIADTLIGAALSYLAVSLLWPDYRYQNMRNTAAQAIAAAGHYLQTYAEQNNHLRDNLPYRSARRRLHETASLLAQYSTDLAAQPKHNPAALSQAQQITDTHYRLIADLSALGANRSDTAMPPEVQRIIRTLGQQLLCLTQTEPLAREKQTQALLQEIAQLPENDEATRNIRQQLNRICKRQEELYQLLYH